MIKLIAVDLDGTLLKNHSKVHKKTINSINKAKELGYQVVIATGRNPVTIREVAKQIGMYNTDNYFIGLNGGMIFKFEDNQTKIIKQYTFEKKEVENIYNLAKEHDITLFSYPEDEQIAIVSKTKGIFIKWMQKRASRKIIDYSNLKDIPNIYKHIAFGKSKPAFNFREEMIKLGYSTFAFSYVSDSRTNVEVNPKNVDKAHALSEVAKLLDVKQKEVIYFGDGENDIKAIEWAGIGCAMDNAKRKVKKVADEIVLSNKKHGVSNRLEKLFIDQEI